MFKMKEKKKKREKHALSNNWNIYIAAYDMYRTFFMFELSISDYL